MTIPALAAAAVIFALLSLPGWLLVRRQGDAPGRLVAAGFASQIAVVLCLALLAAASPVRQPALAALPIAVILALIAWRFPAPRTAPAAAVRPAEAWAFLTPCLAVGMALFVSAGAIDAGPQGVVYHAYFDADFFKHLAHVRAVEARGLPPVDLFGAGGPLLYYWLFYPIPAMAAALGIDAQAALLAAGFVQTFFFWFLAYGLCRLAGGGPRLSALVSLIAFLSPSLDGLAALSATGGHWWQAATGINLESMGANLVNASTLFRLNLYIPQHQLALAGLLSWAILALGGGRAERGGLRAVLATAPLVALMGISIFLGAVCLGAFGLFQLWCGAGRWRGRVLRTGLVGGLAALVPFAIGVIRLDFGDSALESPIFDSGINTGSPLLHLAQGVFGLLPAFGGLLILGLAGLCRGGGGEAETQARARRFGICLVAAGILAMLLSGAALGNARLVIEIQMRASFVAAFGLMIGLVRLGTIPARSLLARAAAVTGAILLIPGFLSPVMDVIWHRDSQPGWTVTLPQDDRAALDFLRRNAAADALVLQYPELPYLSGGRDTWVPVFAGRAILGAPRATDWPTALPLFQQAQAFFDDRSVADNPLLSRVSWIYLSRALHPESFDALRTELDGLAGWQSRYCNPGACLFARGEPPATDLTTARQ